MTEVPDTVEGGDDALNDDDYKDEDDVIEELPPTDNPDSIPADEGDAGA